MSVDLSFMDLLFDKEDPVIGFEKDVKNEDLKHFNVEEKQLNNDDWVCTADSFLDSILQMENDEQPFELLQNCDLLNDNKAMSDSFHLESSSSCSDSGLSSDQQMSPPPSIHEGEFDDIEIKEEIVDVDTSVYEELPTLDGNDTRLECNNNEIGSQHSIVINESSEQLQFPVLDKNHNELNKSVKSQSQIQFISSDAIQSKDLTQPLLKQSNLSLKEHKSVIRAKPVGITNPNRHVLRVTPITSANPRSILIPVNMKSVGGTTGHVRTIKIINTTNRTIPSVNTIKATKQIPRIITQSANNIEKKVQSLPVSTDDSNDEDQSAMYPRLHLTAEEKRLMAKEGVSLPSHYPLTKQEERELKRIRRKIRNKISAQDSRKRKKEYVDGLEDRVKQCTEENLTLMKRLKALQSQNQSLSAQLKKLQAVVARGTTQTAQPATCLMVLMLSLALVMAPNLRHARSATNRDLSLPEGESKNPLAGRSRSLLFSKHADVKLKPSDIPMESDDLLDSGLMSDLEELLKFNNKPSVQPPVDTQYDHDYVESRANRKRTRSYIVPPLDDSWPPPKKLLIERIEDTLEEKINKSRLGTEPLEERNKQIVIHISSDDEGDDVISNYDNKF